jgi:hypothetical protein
METLIVTKLVTHSHRIAGDPANPVKVKLSDGSEVVGTLRVDAGLLLVARAGKPGELLVNPDHVVWVDRV